MARASMQNRQITIYLPTESDVGRWQSLSKLKSCSLSRFVFEMVELGLENRPPPALPATSSEELNNLRKEISDLKRENEQLWRQNNQLIETQRSSTASLPRIKLLEEAVKVLLQKGGTWSNEKLQKGLKSYADPQNLNMLFSNSLSLEGDVEKFEQELITDNPMKLNMLNKALNNLIDRGQIEESERGFRWKK